MILVVADPADGGAASLVEALRGTVGASLVTPRDLSTAGWVLRVPQGGTACAVAEGRTVPASGVCGCVVRLAAITPSQLPWVHADDRGYVAAEMTAFLGAWLASLDAPVLNPPGVHSLCGPGWQDARWRAVSRRAGVVPCPARQGAELTVVSLVGDHAAGGDAAQLRVARRLQAAAAVPMLRVHLDGTAVCSVDTWLDLADEETLAAVVRWAAA